jgi:microcystin-dependent protein
VNRIHVHFGKSSKIKNISNDYIVNVLKLIKISYLKLTDGQIGDEPVGTVRSSSLANIPYGWLECNGQAVSRTTYSVLFDKFSTQLYDDPSSVQDPTHTLLSRYGEGDGTNTFNLPDYRECALVGIGSNGTFITDNTNQSHEIHTLGEFKDDQLQGHYHKGIQIGDSGSTSYYKPDVTLNYNTGNGVYIREPITDNTNGTPRIGSTTHGKQIGVTYLIKVL